MSGPKRSTWSIDNAIRRELARDIRRSKENELASSISRTREKISILSRSGRISMKSSRLLNEWLAESERNIHGDLRIGWRGLNGVVNYLEKLEKEEVHKKTGGEKNNRKNSISSDHGSRKKEPSEAVLLISALEKALSYCPASSKPAVRQRIALFSKALEVNPNNSSTLEQARDLYRRMEELAEEEELGKREMEYAVNVFAEILGKKAGTRTPDAGKEGPSGEQGSSISGNFQGMPLEITVDNESKGIAFHTPENGDCKALLMSITRRLSEKGVAMGTVHVERTGENWNLDRKFCTPDRKVNA